MNKIIDRMRQGFRSFLKEEDDAVIHIPRLLAITIPVLFVTICHIIAHFSDSVPEILLEPVIDTAIIMTGGIIAVLGMSVGLLTPFLLIVMLWGISFYIYVQFVIDII